MSIRYSSPSALATVASLVALVAIGLQAGTVSSVTPRGASPTTTISITGTGFNPTAASNSVTFRHIATNVVTTAAGTTIQTLDATRGIRRLSVKVPTDAPMGTTAVRIRDTASNEDTDAGNIEVLRLTLSNITSGAVGTSQQVRIVGSPNVVFAPTNTRAAFGAGITVQSTVVESPTSLVANIVIAANAALGPRVAAVQTTNQVGSTDTPFMVTAAGTPPNRNPTSNAGGPYSGRINMPILFSGSGSDPDGDALTLAWDFGDGTAATGATPSHAFSAVGTYLVKLTVTDGRGGSAMSQANVLVEPPQNTPPQFTSTAITTATQGAAYQYQLAATDPDGDAVAFALRQAPPGLTLDPTGLVQWTPGAGDVGTASVSLEVSDGRGGSALQTFTIVVAAANRPPVANAGGPYSGTVNASVAFDASASSDPDQGQQLSFSWDFGDGATATGATPAHTYASEGSFVVTLTVSDGNGGTHQATVSATITPASLGIGVVAGRVFDDVTGLPLAGAVAQLLTNDGADAGGQPALTDSAGRFRLATTPGLSRVRVSRSGYTRAERSVNVVDGKRVDALDVRLAPIDSLQTPMASVIGGVAHNTTGTLSLKIPPGALAADATVALTLGGAQSAGSEIPLGWSALGVADVRAGTASFNIPATLSLRSSVAVPVDLNVLVAKWNAQSGLWIAEGNATRSNDDDREVIASATSPGEYVWLLADAPPQGPNAPAVGAPITGVSPRAPPTSVTATITPSPRVLFARPDARSLVSVAVTPSAPLPSGTPLSIEVNESFELSAGRRLDLAPSVRTFALQRGAQPSASLRAGFQVAPARRIAASVLRRGVIDLAARLMADPFAARGTVVGPAGGSAVAAGGERLTVPPSATSEYVPALVAPLITSGVVLPIPTNFTLLGGVAVDLHGGTLSQPATLAMNAPAGLPADAFVLVAQLAEVENVTRLVLVAAARREGTSLITVTEPLTGTLLGMPGIVGDGRYLFLQANAPLGFLSGTISGPNGAPIQNAFVDAGFGVAALTDAAGHYVLAGPTGDVVVRATHPTTGDTTTVSGRIESPQSASGVSTTVGPTPPFVVGVTPANGLTNVSRSAVVSIAFSEPIDPASVAGAISMFDGATLVAGSISLAPGNTGVVFQPGVLLASSTAYEVRIASTIRDAAGNTMTSPFVARFTTLDDTPPPRPIAGAISATIPDASGTSLVSGTQGTGVPGGQVRIRNLRTGALTTVAPNADGSFSGLVPALRTDHLELILLDAAQNATTVAVPAFKNPDGSVVMGASGGRLDAAGGLVLDVPAGALPEGTVVKLEPLNEAQLPVAVPADLGLVGGFRLDLGGVVSTKELELSVPAPNGTAGGQVVVAKAIPFQEGQAWTVVERAHFSQGRYQTASPPFSGVIDSGSYSFLQWDASACVSYISIQYSFNGNVFLMPNLMPFVFFTTDVHTTTMPAYCGAQLNVQVLDPNINEVIQTISYFAPSAADDIAYPPDVLTDDHTKPQVLSLNNPMGQETSVLEVRFTKSMSQASIDGHFIVQDSSGASVGGATSLSASNSLLTFRPHLPFRLGEHYTVLMAGLTDTAGNPIDAQPLTFTPYGPRSLSELRNNLGLAEALEKCGSGGCTTSAIDVAYIGKTLFVANGVRRSDEQYHDPSNPHRLVAVDITDPFHPTLIGWHETSTNPRALAAVPGVSLNTSAGVFTGDLLLVAGGGRVAGGELNGKLEVWDVRACTQRPVLGNCLQGGLKGFRFLSTASGIPPQPNVPPDSGIPLQVTTIHQKAALPAGDTLIAYVLTVPIGIEAVKVPDAFNLGNTTGANMGPDGLLRGDFVDVTAIKNKVLAVGRSATNNLTMSLLSSDLGLIDDLPSPPSPLLPPQGAIRVASGANLVYDLDADGRVGTAEDTDNDPGTAAGEIFDLALVSSGDLSSGCAGAPPCGELYIYDISAATELAHAPPLRFLDVVPLPGPVFSAYIDPAERVAYVELRGKGIAVVDLSFLLGNLRGDSAIGFVDGNEDHVDDRVLAVVPTGSGQQDLALARLKIDPVRGIAFVNGAATGVELVQVTNKATELALDFGTDADVGEQSLAEERQILKQLVTDAVAKLRAESGLQESEVSALEQGSGSCFWRPTFPTAPESTCPAFQAGTSDHDIEIFVPQERVREAQQILNAFIKSKPAGLSRLGDLSLFAMPREAFAAAELLNGTPLYGEGVGDATGDLGMGRQILLLLWLLEGAYVDGLQGNLPDLAVVLERLRAKKFASALIPDAHEPTGIPRLEGYEWSLLQEFNFYKTGAMLRVSGGCDAANRDTIEAGRRSESNDANDPSANFNDEGFLGDTCDHEVHGVAKASIRAVLARIVADEAGNELVLNIDPDNPNASGADMLQAYKSDACFTGPFLTSFNQAEAAAQSGPYARRACTGFEHYILSVAVRTLMNGLTIFEPSELPLLYRFYCLKVSRDTCRTPAVWIQGDEDADSFLRAALIFIKTVQLRTRPRYVETVSRDDAQIGVIPLLNQGPTDSGGGISGICGELFTVHGSKLADFISPATLPSSIEASIPSPPNGPQGMRKLLRLCNYLIVYLKIKGDETIALGGADPNVHVQPNVSLGRLKQRLGVEHYVDWDLQVRAINYGIRHVDVNLTLYEGSGRDASNYKELKSQRVGVRGGERRIIASEPVPGSTDPDKRQPIYPVLFNLSRPEISSGSPRALTFFIDPEGTIPEANKRDNQASFFYYLLTPGGGAPPLIEDDAVPPLDDDELEPDPLAVERPRLSFDFTLRGQLGGTFFGGKQISVGLFEPVQLKYEIKNLSAVPLENVRIYRDGQIAVQIPVLAPVGTPGDRAFITDSTNFVPTDTGTYHLRTYAFARDEKGNTVGPAFDIATVTATEDLQAAKIRLFDASPLAEQNHPFSRFLANRDNAGHEVPLMGAVTDGDDAGGGGRIRVEIERLQPGLDVTVAIEDGELAGITDGVGTLEYPGSPSAATGVSLSGVHVDVFGRAVLYYRPPPAFVRDAHRDGDVQKQERSVRLRVQQTGVGGGVATIRLRRPPVFLVHGLFSTRKTWNELQPLVPETGVGPAYAPFKGFDGRFDVFAVGSPFASGTFAEEAAALKEQIRGSLAMTLPGYAVGKVDVIGHSMGALLTRRLANEFAAAGVKSPFRKLIAVDAPFGGSQLANKIREIRGETLVTFEDPSPKDYLGAITDVKELELGETSPQSGIQPEVKLKAEIQSCALIVQTIGLTPRFFTHGAVQDLEVGSDELTAIVNGGLSIPSHHVVGQTATPGLGIGWEVFLLWGALGQYCNLTPDPSTEDATVLFQTGVKIAQTALTLSQTMRNIQEATPKLEVSLVKFPAKSVSESTEKFLKRAGPIAQVLQDEATSDDEIKPVFESTENDRIVQADSQAGGISPGDPAVSSVVGVTDHTTIIKSAAVPVSACNLTPSALPATSDLNGDGTRDSSCRIIHLLEASPVSPFFKSAP